MKFGRCPTIPNFIILYISFKILYLSGFLTLRCSRIHLLYTFLHQRRGGTFFKPGYSLCQRVVCDVHVSIHRGLNTCISQKLLQHLGLHTRLNRSCGIRDDRSISHWLSFFNRNPRISMVVSLF